MGKHSLFNDEEISKQQKLVKEDYALLRSRSDLSSTALAYNLAHSLFELIMLQVSNDATQLFYLSMIVGQTAKLYEEQQDQKEKNLTIKFQKEIQKAIDLQQKQISYYAPDACIDNHHLSNKHPESHHRLAAIKNTLETMQMVKKHPVTSTVTLASWPHYTSQCRQNMTELLSGKNKNLNTVSKNFPEFVNLCADDVPITHNTRLAVEAALSTADDAAERTLNNIKNNKSEKIFCAIRPPSHHAHPDHPEGFCYANSVIHVAEKLMRAGKKVMIIDIDAHHGNGTYEHLAKLPQELQNKYRMVDVFGVGEGSYMDKKYMAERLKEAKNKPYCDKIHLHPIKSTAEYTGGNVLNKIQDSVNQFKQAHFTPDVVLVSAGFDAAQEENFGGNLSPHDFGKIGQYIASISPNVISLVEGGYCYHKERKNSLQQCVYNYIAGTATLLPREDAPYPFENLSAVQNSLEFLYHEIMSVNSNKKIKI